MAGGRKPPNFARVDPPAAPSDAELVARPMLSLKRAAKYMGGVSVEFVRDLYRAKKLRSLVVGRKRVIPLAEVRRYLRELVEAQAKE